MADITIDPFHPHFVPKLRVIRAWAVSLDHSVTVLYRRARRDRHLAHAGRSLRRYPWFEALFANMSGR